MKIVNYDLNMKLSLLRIKRRWRHDIISLSNVDLKNQ